MTATKSAILHAYWANRYPRLKVERVHHIDGGATIFAQIVVNPFQVCVVWTAWVLRPFAGFTNERGREALGMSWGIP